MTEWDALEYARISALQEAMAEEVLLLLDLKGTKRVLDVGCGNGKVTAEIASRIPQGAVLGVDSSADMIAFASSHFGPVVRPNLRFEIADARRLPYRSVSQARCFDRALRFIEQGRVTVDKIVSDELQLSEYGKALDGFRERRTVKTMLVPTA